MTHFSLQATQQALNDLQATDLTWEVCSCVQTSRSKGSAAFEGPLAAGLMLHSTAGGVRVDWGDSSGSWRFPRRVVTVNGQIPQVGSAKGTVTRAWA